MKTHSETGGTAVRRRRKLPTSFKDLTPSHSFDPRSFFKEMVWKTLFTKRIGQHQKPVFPDITLGQVAITWIGHASFLIQFNDLNILIDPIFANWLFILKRLKRAGMKLKDLPPVDLVLLTHAHYDHFHKRTIRRLDSPKLGIMPWGMGELTRGLGFRRTIELEWWESFTHKDLKITFTPCKHWGARSLHDEHRGFGGFILEHQGRSLYHAGDSAYFEGFKEIGNRCKPEIALLPIGAYRPDGFRRVHMGPDEAAKAFHDLQSKWLIPMHYGSFKLSFEALDEPLRWMKELARQHRFTKNLRILEEGFPEVF